MHIVRKILVALGTPLLTFLALLAIFLLSANLAFGQPDNLKLWVDQSGVYQKVPDILIKQATDPSQSNSSQSSNNSQDLSLAQPEVQQALKAALTPTFLKTSVESVINGSYGWLQGKTPKPVYVIDLAPVKQAFADSLVGSALARVNTLPACTWYNQPTTTDPFKVNCKPPQSIIDAEVQQLTADITSASGPLSQDTITADTVNISTDIQTAQQTPTTSPTTSTATTPWYQNLAFLPAAYTWVMWGPWILALFGLLIGVGLVFAASSKRGGLRIISAALLSSGLLLVVSSFASIFVFNKLGETIKSGSSTDLQSVALSIIKSAGSHISHTQLWWGIGLTIVGLIGLLVLYFTRPKEKQPPVETQPKPPISDKPKP